MVGTLVLPAPAGLLSSVAAAPVGGGVDTGMEIEGNYTRDGAPPKFDWKEIYAAAPGTAPRQPYAGAGFTSTGILGSFFGTDGPSLADACNGKGDVTAVTPGTHRDDAVWPGQQHNVHTKDDLCTAGAAYEIITRSDGAQETILYAYFTRAPDSHGDQSTLFKISAGAAGRCGDYLFEFDFNPGHKGYTEFESFKWDCANGGWVPTATIGYAAAGEHADVAPVGNNDTFGEIAINLTRSGILPAGACESVGVGEWVTQTGNGNGTLKDILPASDGLTVSNCRPDVKIVKTAPARGSVNGTLDYTLTVTNTAGVAANNLVVTDTLPAGVTFVSATGGCVNNNGTITCNIGTLAVGASAVRTITVRANTAGTICNTATVAPNDPTPGDNTSTDCTTVDEPEVDVDIVKDATATTTVGGRIVYTLRASNTGTVVANNVVVTDRLPAGVTFVSASAGCTNNAGTITCNIGTLAVGGNAVRTITVTANTAGTICNTATVTPNDPTPGDNVSRACTTITDPPSGWLEICKAASGSGLTNQVFKFTVNNTITVNVPVGACSAPIQVPVGNAIIKELAQPGSSLVSVTAYPASRLVSVALGTRTATVKIVAGNISTQTIATFTNKAVPGNGLLKVCKVAGPGVAIGTSFTFSIGTKTVSVPAGPAPGGYCVVVGSYPRPSNVTITEAAVAGYTVSNITVAPSTRARTINIAGRTATVTIGSGVTEVTFTNRAS